MNSDCSPCKEYQKYSIDWCKEDADEHDHYPPIENCGKQSQEVDMIGNSVIRSQSVEMSWEQCNTESVSRDELGAV
jgi:hypothetical protein